MHAQRKVWCNPPLKLANNVGMFLSVVISLFLPAYGESKQTVLLIDSSYTYKHLEMFSWIPCFSFLLVLLFRILVLCKLIKAISPLVRVLVLAVLIVYQGSDLLIQNLYFNLPIRIAPLIVFTELCAVFLYWITIAPPNSNAQ